MVDSGTARDDDLHGLDAEGLMRAGLNSLDQSPGLAGFVAPTTAELQPLFEGYEIFELVGQGGMGAVYRALHVELGRLVAIKVLAPHFKSDPAFAERFRQEAQTLARLRDPRIVAVYDFGEAGPYLFLAMEFVEGENLRTLLEQGPLEPSRAREILLEVCAALSTAHGHGVIHRDIKPANVLVANETGAIFLADFGLAKSTGPREALSPSLTGSRHALGTPNYMAPEQLEAGTPVDQRTDLYSVGVLSYELLTAKLPIGRFAPPSERQQGVSKEWDPIVLRLLEADPERRFQSVAELREQLTRVTLATSSTAQPTGRRAGFLALLKSGSQGPRVVKRNEFVGAGCLVQGLGLMAPLTGGAMTGAGGAKLGLVVGLGLLVLGGRMALRWACSECGSRLPGRKVKVCISCGTAFA